MPAQQSHDTDFAKKFAIPGVRYHTVTQFGGDIYKITQHYGPDFFMGPKANKAEAQHSDVKLSSSISRTKRLVLELALCNDWEYFITLTLDKEKVNRVDLDAWHKKFKDWLKYRRKAYGLKIAYLLVPEQHADGSWHAHGLVRGVFADELLSFTQMDKDGYRTPRGKRLPKKLRESDYLNWPAFQKSFGYCSLGPIRNHAAASMYVTKYITKDLSLCVSQCGKHMFWYSQGLNRPVKFGEFADRSPYIDSLLVNKYEFCATGFVLPGEGWSSDFAADLIESVGGQVFSGAVSHPAFQVSMEPTPAELEADKFHQYEQMILKM